VIRQLTIWIIYISQHDLGCCVVDHYAFISRPVSFLPFATLHVDIVQAEVFHYAHVKWTQIGIFTASSLAKTEAFCASVRVLFL
jgi:hypothetical protein